MFISVAIIIVFPFAIISECQRHRAVVMIRWLSRESAFQIVESADRRNVLCIESPISANQKGAQLFAARRKSQSESSLIS